MIGGPFPFIFIPLKEGFGVDGWSGDLRKLLAERRENRKELHVRNITVCVSCGETAVDDRGAGAVMAGRGEAVEEERERTNMLEAYLGCLPPLATAVHGFTWRGPVVEIGRKKSGNCVASPCQLWQWSGKERKGVFVWSVGARKRKGGELAGGKNGQMGVN